MGKKVPSLAPQKPATTSPQHASSFVIEDTPAFEHDLELDEDLGVSVSRAKPFSVEASSSILPSPSPSSRQTPTFSPAPLLNESARTAVAKPHTGAILSVDTPSMADGLPSYAQTENNYDCSKRCCCSNKEEKGS